MSDMPLDRLFERFDRMEERLSDISTNTARTGQTVDDIKRRVEAIEGDIKNLESATNKVSILESDLKTAQNDIKDHEERLRKTESYLMKLIGIGIPIAFLLPYIIQYFQR